jgi:hypothetical protein
MMTIDCVARQTEKTIFHSEYVKITMQRRTILARKFPLLFVQNKIISLLHKHTQLNMSVIKVKVLFRSHLQEGSSFCIFKKILLKNHTKFSRNATQSSNASKILGTSSNSSEANKSRDEISSRNASKKRRRNRPPLKMAAFYSKNTSNSIFRIFEEENKKLIIV